MNEPQKDNKTTLFSTRLRELIDEQKDKTGKSLRELANDMNVSFTVLSDWQCGNKTPRADSLLILSKYFGVTTDYLLGLTDSPTIEKDIRAAADLTGLSTEAIERLAYEVDANDWIGKPAQWMDADKAILSDMIESDTLRIMVDGLKKCQTILESCVRKHIINEDGSYIETTETRGAKLCKYDAQEAFTLYCAKLWQDTVDSAKAGGTNGTDNKKNQ